MKTKPKTINLEWKRAKKDETLCATRRTWESRCGYYKVQESVSKFGLPTIFYALFNDEDVFVIISQHKKYKTAEDACVKHAKSK